VKRGAFYEACNRKTKFLLVNEIVIALVREVREEQPRAGTPQLYETLKPEFKQRGIKMGRDALNDLLREANLQIKPKRRRPKTTWSDHKHLRFANLIKDWEPDAPEQLWVADISYVYVRTGFAYLFLLTDGYSRKIMGWTVSATMEGINALFVLKMAVSNRIYADRKLIHHSDQGSQYAFGEYIQLLRANGISPSMAARGKSYENPIAERINGIVKVDLGCDRVYDSVEDAKTAFDRIIRIYNSKRLHSSCDYLTPEQAHLREGKLKKHWKNTRTKKHQSNER
jgi:transposase InsO family protein